MSWLPRLHGRADLTDEEAMRRVQRSGDPAAFARLVARWQRPIVRLCVRMIDDTHGGEDLAQETFAAVFTRRQQFDPSRKFSTWIWRIALNRCHEALRRHARAAHQRADEPGGDHPAAPRLVDAADEIAISAEQSRLVREALQKLSETHRSVLVLREYENLKFREIADVLELPEGTVKWRMSEALIELRRHLLPMVEPTPRKPQASKEGLLL